VRLISATPSSEKTILETCLKLAGEDLDIADIVLLKEWGDTKGFSLAQGQ
jgi:hypothetical protein